MGREAAGGMGDGARAAAMARGQSPAPAARPPTDRPSSQPPNRQADGDLDEYIRKTIHSGNALVGTCRMGGSKADGSVVSSADLKVGSTLP